MKIILIKQWINNLEKIIMIIVKLFIKIKFDIPLDFWYYLNKDVIESLQNNLNNSQKL